MNKSSEWNNRRPALPNRQMVYQIIGFDRSGGPGLNFVGDVANAIPQNEHCRITGLLFEGDGIRADGCLTVQVPDDRHLFAIDQQLRAVRRLVSAKQMD